jgi:hypothetical protein
MVSQRETLPFRRLIDTSGQIILIALDVTRLHQAAHLCGSLLTSAIAQAALSRIDVPEASRNQCFVLADEFENVVSSQWLEILCEGRRFGMSACLFHQGLSQVPTEISDLVLNNCRTQLYYQTGARDAAQLAREIGGGAKTPGSR